MPQELSDQGPTEERPEVEVNDRGWPILRPADRAASVWSQPTGPATTWERHHPEMS